MKLAVIVASLLVLGSRLATAQQPQRPAFEVASLKKNVSGIPGGQIRYVPGGRRFTAMDATVPMLIQWAYDISEFQLIGVSEPFKSQRFDVEAKPDASVSEDQVRLMLQVLLEDRFGLRLQKEQREMHHFALSRDRSDGGLGPGLMKLSGDFDCQTARNTPDPNKPKQGTLVILASNCGALRPLTSVAMSQIHTFVADRTGLSGEWFYRVYFAPTEYPRQLPVNSPLEIDASIPVFTTAIKDQLGLKLESARGPVDVLVVESIHAATEN